MIENKEVMARNLIKQMKLKGVKSIDVCRTLGIKQNSFSDWVNAKTYPRIDKIELMANYFGVKKSELVEENVGFMVSDDEKNLINLIRDNGTFTQVYKYAQFLNKEGSDPNET